MKKVLSFLLCLVSLFLLIGCTDQHPEETPVITTLEEAYDLMTQPLNSVTIHTKIDETDFSEIKIYGDFLSIRYLVSNYSVYWNTIEENRFIYNLNTLGIHVKTPIEKGSYFDHSLRLLQEEEASISDIQEIETNRYRLNGTGKETLIKLFCNDILDLSEVDYTKSNFEFATENGELSQFAILLSINDKNYQITIQFSRWRNTIVVTPEHIESVHMTAEQVTQKLNSLDMSNVSYTVEDSTGRYKSCLTNGTQIAIRIKNSDNTHTYLYAETNDGITSAYTGTDGTNFEATEIEKVTKQLFDSPLIKENGMKAEDLVETDVNTFAVFDESLTALFTSLGYGSLMEQFPDHTFSAILYFEGEENLNIIFLEVLDSSNKSIYNVCILLDDWNNTSIAKPESLNETSN